MERSVYILHNETEVLETKNLKKIYKLKTTQKNLEGTVQVRNSTNEGIKIKKNVKINKALKKNIKGHINYIIWLI